MQLNVSAEFNSDLLDNNLENSGLTTSNFPNLKSYPVSQSLSLQQKQGEIHFFTYHRSHPVYAGATTGLKEANDSATEDLFDRVRQLDADVPLIVLGLGLGDHADLLLSKTHAKIIVLEKNPGFVKTALSRFDWSEHFRNDKLHILEPLYFVNNYTASSSTEFVSHPYVGKCYFDVAHILNDPDSSKPVDLLMDGALLIDDWYTTLVDNGYLPYIYPPNYYDISKIRSDLQHYNIRKIWSINRLSGLEKLAEQYHMPYSIYEIDPDLSEIPHVPERQDYTTLFSYRKPQAEWYHQKGWNAVYLPLATNPKRFRASADDRYRCRICFVGDSILGNANKLKQQLYPKCNVDQQKLIETFWQDQAAHPGVNLLPNYRDNLASLFSSLLVQTEKGTINILKVLSEWSGACHRVNLVRSASEFGIDVWGDDAWKIIADKTPGVNYRGRAAHLTEVPKIYASSYINLDITRIYQPDVATLRLFDVFASGSLTISNIEGENGELYPDPRLITYTNATGMMSRINEVLGWSESTYTDYVNSMQEYTLNNHTFSHRLHQMMRYRSQNIGN